MLDEQAFLNGRCLGGRWVKTNTFDGISYFYNCNMSLRLTILQSPSSIVERPLAQNEASPILHVRSANCICSGSDPTNPDLNAPIGIVSPSTGDQTVITITRCPGAQPSHAQVHQQCSSVSHRFPGENDMVQAGRQLNCYPTAVVGELSWKVVRRGGVDTAEG